MPVFRFGTFVYGPEPENAGYSEFIADVNIDQENLELMLKQFGWQKKDGRWFRTENDGWIVKIVEECKRTPDVVIKDRAWEVLKWLLS